jgi:Phosphotransferase enzyme family
MRSCSPASTSSDHAASRYRSTRTSLAVDGWTLSAQQVLPGASVRNPSRAMVEQVVECVAAMAGVACPLPAPDLRPWGESVVHTLTVGVDGWAMHEPMRSGGRRSAAVLDRVEAVGADADPAWFPTYGLVHLDLHTDNILAGDDGTLTGIIDWEGACAGDPRFDLVRFAYDLDGHDQPVWTSSRPPASSGACFERTSPTTRCGARPGRSTTTPMTCPASSTAPSASSIGTRRRRRRPWPNTPGRVRPPLSGPVTING